MRRLVSSPDIDVNLVSDGETALHLAAHRGLAGCVRLLLGCPRLQVNRKYSGGGLINKEGGQTALLIAVRANQKSVVELLVRDRRTDLKTRDINNQTLVQVAL